MMINVDFFVIYFFRKDIDRVDLILFIIVNKRWLQIVIKFYEDRVIWI